MNPAKNKKIRYILITTSSLLILITAGIIIFLHNFPKEYAYTYIIDRAVQTLNRKVTADKFDINIRGIFLSNVKIYNGLKGDEEVLATADSVKVGFSLLKLIKKKFYINRLSIEHLELNITFDKNGKSNLEAIIADAKKNPDISEGSPGISRITLQRSIIRIKNPPEIMKPLEGSYEINTKIKIDNEDLTFSNCQIKLPEERGVLNPNIILHIDKKSNFVITGSVDLNRASLLWVYKWADSPLPYKTATGKIRDLKITPNSVEGSVSADSSLTNSPKTVSASGYCRVGIDGSTIHITGLDAKIEKSSIAIKELLLSFSGNIIKIDADRFDMLLSDARLILQFLPQKIYGTSRGNFKIINSLMSGSFQLTDAGYDKKVSMVTGINTEIKIINNIFKEENIKLKIFGNPCSVSVASADGKIDRVFVNVFSKDFTISDSQIKYDETPSIELPFNLSGQINLNSLLFKPLAFRDFIVNYSIVKNIIELKRFSCLFMDGSFSGSGSVDLNTKPYKASLAADFKNVKVQNIAKHSEKLANRLYGNAEGRFNIDFLMTADIVKSLYGRTELTVSNGKLVNTGIQNGLGIWLTELKYKLRDIEFNKIYSNLLINRDHYIINSFLLNSENLRLKIRGKIDNNLIADNMNLDLEFTKNFINDLPTAAIAISLNKYLQGSWYMIPFVLNGDITNKNNIKKSEPLKGRR